MAGKGLWALALALVLATGANARAQAITASGVRLGGDARSTRVVIDLTATVAAPRVKSAADTVEVDLRNVAGDLPGGAGRGLVASWRWSLTETGARLDLATLPGARIAHRFLIPPSLEGGSWRYVLDLSSGADAGADPIAALVPAAPTPRGAVRSADVSRARFESRRKVVVIDAGHGGHDTGALGPSQREKDLTLAAAETLKGRLERTGRYKVVLTRQTDVFIPLEQRVKIARQCGADLFLSLHADSAGGVSATHGASVYTLSDSGVGRAHYVIGRDEWFTHIASRGDDPKVSDILLDLSQRSTRNRSAVFADLLLSRLAGEGVDLLPRSHRDAGYFVLLAPDVPAALLEMGFITNVADESRLADADQRSRMMDAVASAIDAYFDVGKRPV